VTVDGNHKRTQHIPRPVAADFVLEHGSPRSVKIGVPHDADGDNGTLTGCMARRHKPRHAFNAGLLGWRQRTHLLSVAGKASNRFQQCPLPAQIGKY
jgi:hypothetical protein